VKLIVGFGNPGDSHSNNRQNIGFKVIDILANNENIDIRVKKKKSIIGRGTIEGEKVVLLKPQTFINLIGESVLYIASFLRTEAKQIICIVEDLSLPLGEMRVDYDNSNLEHEGVDSIAKVLRSDKFAKVRVGIGTKPKKVLVEKYLLQDFIPEENLVMIDVLNKTEEVVRMLLNHSIEEVQEKFNPEGVRKVKRRVVKPVKVDHRRKRVRS